jgi:hypothetical protein
MTEPTAADRVGPTTLCRHCRKAIAQLADWSATQWLHFQATNDGHAAEPLKWLREDW